MNAERKLVDEHSSNGGRRLKRRKPRRTRRAFAVWSSAHRFKVWKNAGQTALLGLRTSTPRSAWWTLASSVRSRVFLCLCRHMQQLLSLLRAPVLHPLFFSLLRHHPMPSREPVPPVQMGCEGFVWGEDPREVLQDPAPAR